MAPVLNPPHLNSAQAIAGPTPPNLMDVLVSFDDHSEGESGYEIIANWIGGASFTQLPPVPGSTATKVRGVIPNMVPLREYRVTVRSWAYQPGGFGVDYSPKSNERVLKMPVRVWPHLRSDGEVVRTAQYLLRHHGADIVVDGVYGAQTKFAVRDFNNAHGEGNFIVLFASTWEKLIVPVQQGSQGDPVSAVQSQLASRGMDVVVDGDFGSQTEAAVKTFQLQVWSATGAQTGIVDAETWSALVNGQPLPG
ncbi:peptidoglycan-binding domain-containing protein [Catellatospora tritici]|uniref:peptidoglycan-binding domain-containing protein n=1 Tax=Catellatospora tritici TaxID=2851566 RepID=UPI001C2CFB7A|nr:peptidoglycan-binding protein [Catellatospora tritici]MBV1856325.1 peptidoglycan-binding protein [Catellatospora tritici]